MPTSKLSSGKTQTLSSTISPYGAIAISVYCQKCSNLRGSERARFIYECYGNIIEKTLVTWA